MSDDLPFSINFLPTSQDAAPPNPQKQINITEFAAVHCFEKSIGSHNITDQSLLPGAIKLGTESWEEEISFVGDGLQDVKAASLVKEGKQGDDDVAVDVVSLTGEGGHISSLENLANDNIDETMGIPGAWSEVGSLPSPNNSNTMNTQFVDIKNENALSLGQSEESEEWEPSESIPLPVWAVKPRPVDACNGENAEAYSKGIIEGRELAQDQISGQAGKKQKLQRTKSEELHSSMWYAVAKPR